MKKHTTVDIISVLFIILFVYAGASKLIDYNTFRIQIGQSPMLTNMASFIGWFVPVTEIVISLMLAISRTQISGLYASFGLMTIFTGYIIAITQFSEFIPCSCGGILQNMGWTEHLIFNIAFTLLAGLAILLHEKKNHTDTILT